MRKAETEGKIKGPARLGLSSQSGRGIGTARRSATSVPPGHTTRCAIRAARVPSGSPYATLRRSLRHGIV